MTNEATSVAYPSHWVPTKKQTTLGLYLKAQKAYAMWKTDPD